MKRCRSLSRVTVSLFLAAKISFTVPWMLSATTAHHLRDLRVASSLVVFARHILGVVEFRHIIESRRCMDACGGDLTHVLRQASPLTVSQLKILHNVLESDSEPWNQLFAATACVCFASTQEADGPMHNINYTLNARSKQAEWRWRIWRSYKKGCTSSHKLDCNTFNDLEVENCWLVHIVWQRFFCSGCICGGANGSAQDAQDSTCIATSTYIRLTTWRVVYLIFCRVLYIPGGAGCLPSTVVPLGVKLGEILSYPIVVSKFHIQHLNHSGLHIVETSRNFGVLSVVG